tara:strand:- start:15548 stop:17221 length:1674 start_codon:yes stop_codon:yes gene_type:complete
MTTNSKVLALKYRPNNFDQLIGQNIIAETITNSIKLNKIPNAYLFCGIRGVGKTTTARIVAKALNCLNGFDKICKESLCQNCKEIQNSNSLDCLEVDGASNTGIDSIKELLEFSRYKPTNSKYKIIIIDEIQMLSKSAFASLLKTLEEPPNWIKFIFATTEVKKIPVTIISRCQRFDLPRVKSNELFEYIKKIMEKENAKISDDALKLIVKISEGSVRDALSLLDRAILSQVSLKEINLTDAQKIFGYFEKSYLIELFNNLFQGKEDQVIKTYRSIYEQGVEPKVFLNDFLEILYYFKNVEYLNLEGTNFSLNDSEFESIKKLSNQVSSKVFLIFWQFTIKTLDELNVVSNQNISVEMFLIRLINLLEVTKINEQKTPDKEKDLNFINNNEKTIKQIEDNFDFKNKTISQIKNIYQEENLKNQNQMEKKDEIIEINSFDELINICNEKKLIKLKYELETNVNLVKFESQRIEISFNDRLDKNFIKDLSEALYSLTQKRWIISLSKKDGDPSKKEKNKIFKSNQIIEVKKTDIYDKMIENFPDAELIDVKDIENQKND